MTSVQICSFGDGFGQLLYYTYCDCIKLFVLFILIYPNYSLMYAKVSYSIQQRSLVCRRYTVSTCFFLKLKILLFLHAQHFGRGSIFLLPFSDHLSWMSQDFIHLNEKESEAVIFGHQLSWPSCQCTCQLKALAFILTVHLNSKNRSHQWYFSFFG